MKINKSCIRVETLLRNIIFYMAILAVFIITYFYCDDADYFVYNREYNSILKTGQTGLTHIFEPGFTLLMKAGAGLGLPFQTWYFLYMFLALGVYFSVIKKNTKYATTIIVLFVVYPYINAVQQIRSTLATGIVVYALQKIILKNNISNKIQYTIAILVASSIHVTSIVFLLFLFVANSKTKKLAVFSSITLIIGPILIISMYRPLCSMIEGISIFQRIVYLLPAEIEIGKRQIVYIIEHLLLLLIFIYVYTSYDKYSDSLNDRIVQRWCNVSIFSMLLSVLVCFSFHGYRFSMYTIVIVYITLMKLTEHSRRERFLSKAVLLGYGLVNMYIMWGPMNPEMYYRLTEVMWRVRVLN